jgi:hypothetical protein
MDSGLNHYSRNEVEVEVKLWPTVSRSVYLGVGLQSGTYNQMSLFCLPMTRRSKSKSKSHYNWRSVSQSVCHSIKSTLRLVIKYYFLSEGCFLKFAVLSLRGTLSDERSGLSFVFFTLVIYQYLHLTFTLHEFYSSVIYIVYIFSFIQSRLSTADYTLLVIISSNIPQESRHFNGRINDRHHI